MKKLDAKFTGVIVKVKDQSIVPDDQWMVFLAKDNAFAQVLPIYRDKCKELGADQAQLNALDRAIQRLDEWRYRNKKLLKVPDADDEELLDQ